MRPVYLILLLVFSGGCIGGATGKTIQQASPNAIPIGLEVGQRAPDFTVNSIDGNIIRLSDYVAQRRPVVVEFIATWCPYCRSDLTSSSSVYSKYSGEVDHLIIGLDLNEGPQVLKKYREGHGFYGTFAVGNGDVLTKYQVTRTTTKYAIDKSGVIIWKGSGAMGEGHWTKLFSALQQA